MGLNRKWEAFIDTHIPYEKRGYIYKRYSKDETLRQIAHQRRGFVKGYKAYRDLVKTHLKLFPNETMEDFKVFLKTLPKPFSPEDK